MQNYVRSSFTLFLNELNGFHWSDTIGSFCCNWVLWMAHTAVGGKLTWPGGEKMQFIAKICVGPRIFFRGGESSPYQACLKHFAHNSEVLGVFCQHLRLFSVVLQIGKETSVLLFYFFFFDSFSTRTATKALIASLHRWCLLPLWCQWMPYRRHVHRRTVEPRCEIPPVGRHAPRTPRENNRNDKKQVAV